MPRSSPSPMYAWERAGVRVLGIALINDLCTLAQSAQQFHAPHPHAAAEAADFNEIGDFRRGVASDLSLIAHPGLRIVTFISCETY